MTDEEKTARWQRWMSNLPRDQFDILLELLEDRDARLRREAREAMREDAAKVCEQQAQEFLSEQYAVGQPLSSFMERFGCVMCAEAIRALATDAQGEAK